MTTYKSVEETKEITKKCDELYVQLVNAAECKKKADTTRSMIADLRAEVKKANDAKNNLPKLESELETINKEIDDISRKSCELTIEKNHLGFFAKAKKRELENTISEMLEKSRKLKEQKGRLEKRISSASSSDDASSDNEYMIHILEKDLEAAEKYDSIVEKLNKYECGKRLYNRFLEHESRLDVGKIIKFGSYLPEFCESNKRQSIEWIILDKDSTSILVISKYAIDKKGWGAFAVRENQWETCNMREWLNSNFYDNAFTNEEKALIQSTCVTPSSNPNFPSAVQGNMTHDNLFLLSITEAKKYFITDNERKCLPHPEYYASYAKNSMNVSWWLRTIGGNYDTNFVTYVEANGGINYEGGTYSYGNEYVRPAMRIRLEYDEIYDEYNSTESADDSTPIDFNDEDIMCNVSLISYGSNKLFLVKTLREINNCGLSEAMQIAETPHALIAQNITRKEAEELKAKLEKNGITVIIG